MPTIADKTNTKVGTKVVRGRDWKWNNQDHHKGIPSIGEVIQCTYYFPDDSNAGWVKVEWESGIVYEYRIGKYEDGKENFDLYLYEEHPTLKFKVGDEVTFDKVPDYTVSSNAYVDFPSQKRYSIKANIKGKPFESDKYELVPEPGSECKTDYNPVFKVGDTVKLINAYPDDKYWVGIGKVDTIHSLKDRILTVTLQSAKRNCQGIYVDKCVYMFPSVCFELAKIPLEKPIEQQPNTASQVKVGIPERELKKEEINTYGLTVGMHLPCDVIEAWERAGYNRNASALPREWKKAATRFRTDRKIVEFKVLDGVVGFLISGTLGVYHRAEGFKEFLDRYQKDTTETPQPTKSKPTITLTGKVTDIVPYPDVVIKVKPKKKKPTI